jgi:hypothetical protein
MIESIVISKVFGQPLFTISGVKSGGVEDDVALSQQLLGGFLMAINS